ncbi:hypothetical protein K469DRAFT_139020 [Zopfia rhizophila CBS 207.26]|uniref:Uncharacterized protein n=1 Tax=Zopfia rhizophila CBS 207.26 TaxID=1314779 RepID=A0A6A6E3H1_9PEZI|nr:hypothetical protein K469DRAFT_139020 [Zopfia rhizophila CBS 207.26]
MYFEIFLDRTHTSSTVSPVKHLFKLLPNPHHPLFIMAAGKRHGTITSLAKTFTTCLSYFIVRYGGDTNRRDERKWGDIAMEIPQWRIPKASLRKGFLLHPTALTLFGTNSKTADCRPRKLLWKALSAPPLLSSTLIQLQVLIRHKHLQTVNRGSHVYDEQHIHCYPIS